MLARRQSQKGWNFLMASQRRREFQTTFWIFKIVESVLLKLTEILLKKMILWIMIQRYHERL